MLDDVNAWLVRILCSALPYAAVAAGWAWTTNGDEHTFWSAMGLLYGLSIGFSFLNTLSGILQWRLYFKKKLIAHYKEAFRQHKFPPKQYHDDDMGNYLSRLAEDADKHTRHISHKAQDFEGLLRLFGNQGILVGARNQAAAEAAFEEYQNTLPRAARSRFDPIPQAT